MICLLCQLRHTLANIYLDRDLNPNSSEFVKYEYEYVSCTYMYSYDSYVQYNLFALTRTFINTACCCRYPSLMPL